MVAKIDDISIIQQTTLVYSNTEQKLYHLTKKLVHQRYLFLIRVTQNI